MIKREELRLGNWVSAKFMNDDCAMMVQNIDYGDEVDLTNGEMGFLGKWKDVSPLEITEDDLIATGFIFGESDLWWNNSWFYNLKENTLGIKDQASFGGIKYVHEFQNLIYALAKIELEFEYDDEEDESEDEDENMDFEDDGITRIHV
jgi:hypothetical protein